MHRMRSGALAAELRALSLREVWQRGVRVRGWVLW